MALWKGDGVEITRNYPLFFVEIGQDGSYCNSSLSESVVYILEPVTTKSSPDSNTDTGWKDVSQAFGFDHHL